jgi:hypothetical protein
MKAHIGGGGQLEQFHNMCVKYTFSKCVAFNFEFSLWVFGLYILIFTKLMLFNVIRIFLILNLRNK